MVKPPCQTLFFKKKFYKKYEHLIANQRNDVINKQIVEKMIWLQPTFLSIFVATLRTSNPLGRLLNSF
jgi:hypothetical protein